MKPAPLRIGLCLAILAGLFGGCQQPDEGGGTSVGNPGLYALTAAEAIDVEITELELPIATQKLLPCDGGDPTMSQPGARQAGDQMAFIAGRWCGMTLEVEDTLHLQLEPEVEPEEEVEVEVPISSLFLHFEGGGLVVDQSSRFLLELGSSGWIDLAELEDAVFDEESWEAWVVTVGQRLQSQSRLFVDSDEDGVISSQERDDGAVGLAADEPYLPPEESADNEDSPDAAGCRASGSVAGLGFALFLGLPVRRRRARVG